MAMCNKMRNNKRSTSSSYGSTVSIMVFIALCVLGVWMLNYNNSGVSPQATTRTAISGSSTDELAQSQVTAKSSDDSSRDSNNNNNDQNPKAFEDNPGDLPDDAIKSDDGSQPNKSNNDNISGKSSEQEITGGGGGSGGGGYKQQEQEQVQSLLGGKESKEEEQKEKEMNQKQLSEDSSGSSTDRNVQQSDDQQTLSSQKGTSDETTSDQDQSQQTENKSSQHQQDRNNNNNSDQSTFDQDKQSDRDQQQQQHDQQPVVESNENSSQDSKKDQVSGGGSSTDEQQPQQEEEPKVLSRVDTQESVNAGGQAEEQQNESQTVISEDDQQQRLKQQQQPEQPQHPNEQKQQSSDPQQNQQTQQQAFPDETHVETSLQSKAPDDHQKQNPDQDSHSKHKKGKAAADPNKPAESNSGDSLLGGGDSSGIPKESKESKKSWATQAAQSENEKERRNESDGQGNIYGYTWQLCNVTAGADYIPCLDNEKALKQLHSTKHFEHRERHCPQEGPTCVVPLPEGYKTSIEWPNSRGKIWYHNVPHTLLAEVKGHQNWVKVTGEFLTFPGGGTQFIHGAFVYIDFLQNAVADIAWGKHSRVILDVGCGVASFGGFLFDRDVLTMSFAPKDEHEAQVQFALERGIPAISAVMGTQRLPFPSRVFDIVHCARCRVPWHNEGGMLLLELNRVLRPGGYFVWSATPVYRKLEEDKEIWKAMSALTMSMCWELVAIKNDKVNLVAAAIYRKPTSNECYEKRKHKRPPMCENDDDPNAAWYVPLQACMHRVPVEKSERGTTWPENWPARLHTPPYWLNSSQMGIYGKPAPQDFAADYEHWKRVINNTYMKNLGINWSKNVRNVMDMRAVYGGFAAALKDLQVWVMNVVNIDSPDTLPIIFERGLFGIYHDWCESFSTYPRTYDLLHADHLFSKLKKRCRLAPVLAEVDRIVRPGGKLIVRDESSAIGEVENLLKSLHWEVHLTFSKNQEGMLSAQKGNWRPTTFADSSEH